MSARRPFLESLAELEPHHPPYLSLRDPAENGWHERRGTVAGLARDLCHGMTSSLHVEPWPEIDGRASLLAHDTGVEVQFWEAAPDGALVAPSRNPYAERLPVVLDTVDIVDIDVDGVRVPTLALMAEPTVTECRFEVDVVYTWVDGSDAAWNDARQARLAEVTGDDAATARTRASSGRARFLDRGELRYSMRSVHLFAPWVRRVHLVTAGQTPAWLDVDHPMINLVDHRDILPAEALPTFNSQAIETGLHRVDGLAEHFVYLNDDVLLGRAARPESFFSPAGLNAAFLSHTTIGLTDQPDAPPFVKSAWNNRRLLQDAFGAAITRNLAHTPHPHRVSVLHELAERFGGDLDRTARTPFRSDTDVSPLSSLAQHYGLLTGSSYVGEGELAYVNISNADVEATLGRLMSRDQDYICLGDHHDHALREERLVEVLHDFFEAYYPVAAPWER